MAQTETRTSDDGWAVEALARFERPLLAYARRYTGDLDAARDLVQDAFLKLCEQPLAIDDPRLGPWLFRVCRNRGIDRLRKERPRPPVGGARSHVRYRPRQRMPSGEPATRPRASPRASARCRPARARPCG